MFKLSKKQKSFRQQESGFSVLELMVGVTIFSIVVSASLGLFGSVLRGQRAAFAIQDLQSNARFTMEFMAKEMRTGTDFVRISSTRIEFVNDDGANIVYRLQGTALERSDNGGSSFLPVTADDVQITDLSFNLAAAPGRPQPFVTIMMQMQGAGPRPEQIISVGIQTSISQRLLAIEQAS